MKAIIIGAGRGQRLMPLTEDDPKCYAEIAGKRILDWNLQSLRDAGLTDIVFIGGWQIDKLRHDYPELTFCHNDRWQQNNILASLMYAREHMADGFVCAYADILYKTSIVRRLMDHSADVTLAVDTAWRERYADRSEHPENDAEKVRVDGGRVLEISRRIPSERAHGEYIGVAAFNAAGAAMFCEHFDRARGEFDGGPFLEAASFEKAYLIHLLQHMLEQGCVLEKVDTHGDYFEIDTTEDYRLANQQWGALS